MLTGGYPEKILIFAVIFRYRNKLPNKSLFIWEHVFLLSLTPIFLILMCEHLFKIFFFYFFLVLIKPSCLSCFYIGVMLASKFNYETRVNAFSDELICYAFVKNTFKRSRQAQSL